MTRWMMILAVVLIASITTANAQSFVATLGYISGNPLTTTCGGVTALPEGYIIKIFWDVDSDGPDLDDPQPVLCDPPDCNSPFLSVNFNEFPVNGISEGFGEGHFITVEQFRAIGGMPNPSRYYLRIYEPDNTTPLWTSDVITLIQGYQDVNFQQDDWTCGGLGPQCIVIDESE